MKPIIYISDLAQVDEFDKPISKTPQEFPYSYDSFVTFRNGANSEANSTVYSDRLYRWDYEKYNELSKKHFGNESQMWSNRQPGKIQDFLRDWHNDRELKLILVMQCCNQSHGNPLWRFDYYSNK